MQNKTESVQKKHRGERLKGQPKAHPQPAPTQVPTGEEPEAANS